MFKSTGSWHHNISYVKLSNFSLSSKYTNLRSVVPHRHMYEGQWQVITPYRYCGMYLLSVLALAPACGTSFLYMRCNRNKIRLASWVIYRMLVSSNTVCHHGTCITGNALQQNYIVETMKHFGNIHVLCYIDGTLFYMVMTVYRSKWYIGLENSVGKGCNTLDYVKVMGPYFADFFKSMWGVLPRHFHELPEEYQMKTI